MSSLYQNDYIYDKHIYEKPYTYDNPYMTYTTGPEANRKVADDVRQCDRPLISAPSVVCAQRRPELIASAANLSTDATLNALLRNSGYLSSTMDRNPLKQSHCSSKQKPGLKASTIHCGHRCRPLPSLPSVIYNQTLSSQLRPSPHRRPRSEVLSTLSSIHSTDSKGPLRPFWETHLYDNSDNSVCDSVSVGDPSGHHHHKASPVVCRWTAISVICLVIVLITMSSFAYFMGQLSITCHPLLQCLWVSFSDCFWVPINTIMSHKIESLLLNIAIEVANHLTMHIMTNITNIYSTWLLSFRPNSDNKQEVIKIETKI